MKRVPYVDLAAQFAEERDGLMARLADTMAQGHWVGGSDVEAFEDAMAAYAGSTHAVAVGSGTDALILGLAAVGVGPGDEVILPPNSFISSAAAVIYVGARPVFADVLDDQTIDPKAVEAAVTPRTRAIMPVHLTGRMADMAALMQVARRLGLAVVEDAAQAVGARFNGKHAGTYGEVGCFSAHPLKNLNAMGDAGFVLTDDAALAERVARLRNNGLEDRDTVVEWGRVSRMDSVQAAVLAFRLGRLDSVIERRRRNAKLYGALLDDGHVFGAPNGNAWFDTFHTFVVQVDRRDDLRAYLTGRGIGTAVHYPVPIHLQPVAANLGYVRGDFPTAERQAERILSLPVHQFLRRDDVHYVAETLNGFFA